MKVRATKLGYYDHIRRREGDVFKLQEKKGFKRDHLGRLVVGKDGKPQEFVFTVEQQFSPNWMEPVDAATPEKVTSSPQALASEQKLLKAQKSPARQSDEVI